MSYHLPRLANHWRKVLSGFLSYLLAVLSLLGSDSLFRQFQTPPRSSWPWVYWYFMDGNLTREGMTADLVAMKKAGIGGVIFLEVDIGIPRGPVKFMSPEWIDLFAQAIKEADRLGIEVAMGTGPGWCGAGGPWVKPADSMQHLVATATNVTGPAVFDGMLPRPRPRTPFFGMDTLTPELKVAWENYYVDEAVLAFPATKPAHLIPDLDERALYYRAPFSSQPGVKPFLPPLDPGASPAPSNALKPAQIVNLTPLLQQEGTLHWEIPEGNWTILRLGRTLTGQTTRPAPLPGLGFETDKFEANSIDAHLDSFTGKLLEAVGSRRRPGRGLTTLHFDSWEMSSQNWSANFRHHFQERRGYDPLPYLPIVAGHVVGGLGESDRFLWDLRQTAQELVSANHVGRIRDYAHRHGLSYSTEPYDMNPCSDLELGAVADVPMCEFWSLGYGFRTEYSCFEAVSTAHTMGRPIVAAEAFTAAPGEDWRQHPASMKGQGDWALAAGINRLAFHRYQHQPKLDEWPGMTMGPYGVYWERTQTWWDMVSAYHTYLARCQHLLRFGLPVADILYLTPEGAPHVFVPPATATEGDPPDRRGHNFDACAPGVLLSRAKAADGRICFPDGMNYRVLVLPDVPTMTPALLRKIRDLLHAGAVVVGNRPARSPSLQGYPQADAEIRGLASELWGAGQQRVRKVGQGTLITPPAAVAADNLIYSAKWVWANEGHPSVSAPPGERSFLREFDLPEEVVVSAIFQLTADNAFELWVNGAHAGSGDNFRSVGRFDVTSLLKPGRNVVRIIARNLGEQPNPAGWIGALHVRFTNGSHFSLLSDQEWSHQQLGASAAPVLELGDFSAAPWNLSPLPPELYPPYDFVAGVLAEFGVPPDFSCDGNVRYAHRQNQDLDLYFLSNRSVTDSAFTAQFRVNRAHAEWWDPISGERRSLTPGEAGRGLIRVPLRLAAGQSGFVIFRSERKTPLPQQGLPFRTIQSIEARWTVAFDDRWGGPEAAEFATLSDWTTRPEPGIRHYSGKAVYSTRFDFRELPKPRGQSRLYLSLGDVKNIASVRLNGKELGVTWCSPWRLPIPPGVLRASKNRLEVTVANLWINRLIADSGLPVEQRLTSTTRNPYTLQSPLHPSGLLGPVTVQIQE